MSYLTEHKRATFGIIVIFVCFVLFLHIAIKHTFISPTKKAFINFILIRAQQSNQDILLQRQRLETLYSDFRQGKKLSTLNKEWLLYIASRYDLTKPDFTKRATWSTLLARVDIVPNSLVIAQAIDESEWGRSRFAKLGNNYFGVWCYSQGCGIAPKDKTSRHFYAVKRYATPLNSVKEYMLNLNAHGGYRQFRIVRARLRAEGRPITGTALVETLIFYSQRRSAYVMDIRNLINRYDLSQYDKIKIKPTHQKKTIIRHIRAPHIHHHVVAKHHTEHHHTATRRTK